MADHFKYYEFDLKLATDCAKSYSDATGLGCTISDINGNVLFSAGYQYDRCSLCGLAGYEKQMCEQTNAYGVAEAERIGGKYIYFCPIGLTNFVSPILGRSGSAAKVTIGPFLMVDLEDFCSYELEQRFGLTEEGVARALPELMKIPFVPPERVSAYSNLLFMSVSFINNISEANRMLESQDSGLMQGQISEYIFQLKHGGEGGRYPLEIEQALLDSIARLDREDSQEKLNQLLGYVILSCGSDLSTTKARIYELTALLSRAAANAGASVEKCFKITRDFFSSAERTNSIELLSYQLFKVMNELMDSVFSVSTEKDFDVIHKALCYIRSHAAEKNTIEQLAQRVHLSPSYFGKLFKKETGYSFSEYLSKLRVEQSKKLLLYNDMPLISVASSVGFEDQSYFSKVFKRETGISPSKYRRHGGKPAQ